MSLFDTETQTLLRNMEARYQLEDHVFQLGENEVLIKVVSDSEALLDELIAKGSDHPDVEDERIPYWADLWHSAIALAEWVSEHPVVNPASQVLELGCGLGMSGIAAGLKGANVLQTDYLPEALDMAALCWRLNILRVPQTAILDWRDPQTDFRPQVLLAADVMYEERNGPPLLKAIKHLLPENGVLLLTEPGRPMGQAFLEQLPAEGFSVHRSKREVWFKKHRVNVHQAEIRWA